MGEIQKHVRLIDHGGRERHHDVGLVVADLGGRVPHVEVHFDAFAGFEMRNSVVRGENVL